MGRYCRLINPLSGSTLPLTSKIACVRQSKMGCIRAHFPLKGLILLNQPIRDSTYSFTRDQDSLRTDRTIGSINQVSLVRISFCGNIGSIRDFFCSGLLFTKCGSRSCCENVSETLASFYECQHEQSHGSHFK